MPGVIFWTAFAVDLAFSWVLKKWDPESMGGNESSSPDASSGEDWISI